jgi:DHA1 family tetracycline resistance protein-like MFS transporter
MTDAQPSSPARRPAVAFVFVVMMLDMMTVGITAPVLPGLITQLLHGDAARAAGYFGGFAAIWAVMQFFASPIIGSLSDRYGRRPVLLASMFGLAADYVVMALAPTIGWLLIGRIISGITSSTGSTANAYIADVTPPEERAARFGLLGAAFGIGFVAGPAIGGLLGQLGPRLPFWGAAVVCFANGLYGLFVVPESLAREHRSPFSFRVANPVGSFDLYRSVPGLLTLAGVIFLYYLAHQVLQSTWALYDTYRYHWSTGMIGVSLAVVGVASVIVQMFVIRRFVERFGERGALYSGLVFGAAGFFIYAIAPTGWLFLAGIPVFSLMSLLTPGAQGLMSRRIPANQQGRLQGANSSLMAIASVFGPVLFTQVFAHTITAWSAVAPVGAPFFLASGLMVLALLLAVSFRPAATPVAQAG